MEVKINDISPIKKEINITVPQNIINQKFKEAYEKIGKTAKIKGFRPGKVPINILKRNFSAAVVQEIFENIINETYYKALSDNNIWPVAHPHITPKELAQDKDFQYSAVVETRPEFKEIKYMGLDLVKEKLTIPEDAVKKELEYMREKHSTTILIEDPEKLVEKGNIVSLDFDGFLEENNTPIEGASAKNYSLEIGNNQFIPGFEEGLLGMKAKETKSIKVKFPQNYTAEKLKGANARFEIKVNEIKNKILPDLNDDFAKTMGSENIEALKDKILNDFKSFKEENIKFNLKQNVAKCLIALNDFQVPSSIILEQKKRLMDDAKTRLAHLGKENVEKYLLEQENEFEKNATSNVKLFFLFEEISKREKISISEEDLTMEFEKMAKNSPKTSLEIREHYKKHGLLEDLKYKIKEDRIYNMVVGNSKVEEKEIVDIEKE